MAMGRPVDCEQYSEKRNRKASDLLLAMLQQQHDYSIPAPEKTEPAPRPEIKIMPPIPNEAFRAALEMFPESEAFRGKVEVIQRAVVAAFPGVTVRDLKSARRTKDVVKPRQIAMYLAKSLTLRTLPEIGRRFGGRDHSTILHAFRKIEGLVKTDPDVAAKIEQIKSSLPVLA